MDSLSIGLHLALHYRNLDVPLTAMKSFCPTQKSRTPTILLMETVCHRDQLPRHRQRVHPSISHSLRKDKPTTAR